MIGFHFFFFFLHFSANYGVPTPLPRMKFLPFPYFFMTWWPTFPTNFTWNCVKSFYLQRIFQNIGYKRTCFLTIWFCLWSNIPLFVFELSYIFHTFENMKFPTFSWPFDPFPKPSWLCQPIPYLFKALKKLIWFLTFSRFFPTRGNTVIIFLKMLYLCNKIQFWVFSQCYIRWHNVIFSY